MNDDKKAFEQFKKHMPKFLKVMWKLGAIDWYRNGTFFSAHMRWWHPLTWCFIVFAILATFPLCVLTQATLKDVYKELWEVLTVDKFFKENPDRLRWYKGG